MQISLILSIYSKTKFLELKKCYESIIKQNSPPDEIVVVFDGMVNADIRNFLTKKKVKLIQNTGNLGLGLSLKKAVKITKYSWIARQDTDCISLRHHLSEQKKFLKINKNVHVLGGHMREIFCSSNSTQIKRVPLTNLEIKKLINFRNPFNHPTVLMDKKAILHVGNYEDFKFFEDYWLWQKMKRKYNFSNIDKILVETVLDSAFYKRRFGLNYFKKYNFFIRKLLQKKFITKTEFFLNLIIRFSVHLISKKIQRFIYEKNLRF